MKPSKKINIKNQFGGIGEYNKNPINNISPLPQITSNIKNEKLPEFSGILAPLFNIAAGTIKSGADYAIQATADFLKVDIRNKDAKTIFAEFNKKLEDPETKKQLLIFAQHIGDNAELIIEAAKPAN